MKPWAIIVFSLGASLFSGFSAVLLYAEYLHLSLPIWPFIAVPLVGGAAAGVAAIIGLEEYYEDMEKKELEGRG